MDENQVEVTIVTASMVLAALAILAPLIGIGQPFQALAVFGGVLLGPGALAYRLATRDKWTVCLMVGVAANIAALMLLGLVAIAIHYWHPKVELIIPATTFILAMVIFFRDGQGAYPSNGYRKHRR